MKTIRYKVHEKLEKILASDDYIEDGGMVISSLAYQNKDLVVTFSLYPDSNREIKQIWELKIINIAAENFSRNWTTYFSFYSDHFLLYELTDAHVDLYYNGKAKSPEKLLLDLYRSHLKTYPEDFSFTYGINPAMDIFKLCKDGSGMFARGPKRILEKYQPCLSKHDIKSNFVGGSTKPDHKLKLLAFGESYFIGEDFLFTPL
ncbi:hypothetical protein D3C87_592250 [compost metagenome]|uniref:hypothetical protein n=1 Tax=Pedobacter ghigonis TaxID=2730403 RepID=UPI000FBF6595|nr:hypothetical protein [Pedobacter ghigonis]